MSFELVASTWNASDEGCSTRFSILKLIQLSEATNLQLMSPTTLMDSVL